MKRNRRDMPTRDENWSAYLSLFGWHPPRPAATFDGEDLYPDDAAKAAALLHSLVTGHPFADGNKRTGAVAAELFLAINGWTLVESEEALYSVVLRVARGELASEALAIWIRQRLTPAEE